MRGHCECCGIQKPVCDRCGAVCRMFMVTDEDWARAGLAPNEFVCVDCFEEAQGISLRYDQLQPVPLNLTIVIRDWGDNRHDFVDRVQDYLEGSRNRFPRQNSVSAT